MTHATMKAEVAEGRHASKGSAGFSVRVLCAVCSVTGRVWDGVRRLQTAPDRPVSHRDVNRPLSHHRPIVIYKLRGINDVRH